MPHCFDVRPSRHYQLILGQSWANLGAILGQFWGNFGAILGQFWGYSKVERRLPQAVSKSEFPNKSHPAGRRFMVAFARV